MVLNHLKRVPANIPDGCFFRFPFCMRQHYASFCLIHFMLGYLKPVSIKLKYCAPHCIEWAGCTLTTTLENEMGRHSAQNIVLYTTIMEKKISVIDNSGAFLSLKEMVFMGTGQSASVPICISVSINLFPKSYAVFCSMCCTDWNHCFYQQYIS